MYSELRPLLHVSIIAQNALNVVIDSMRVSYGIYTGFY